MGGIPDLYSHHPQSFTNLLLAPCPVSSFSGNFLEKKKNYLVRGFGLWTDYQSRGSRSFRERRFYHTGPGDPREQTRHMRLVYVLYNTTTPERRFLLLNTSLLSFTVKTFMKV